MTAEVLDHARTALQTISTLALVGSVIYAAVQLRNWHRSQQVTNFIKLVELQMQLRRMRVDRPELAEVHKHDTDDLATQRDVQFFFLNLMQLSIFEIAWYSHKMGQLNDDYFRSWERRMRVIKCEASFQQMWEKRSMKILHDDFERYMRELMLARGDCGDKPSANADHPPGR